MKMITSVIMITTTTLFLLSSSPTTAAVLPQPPLTIGRYKETCPEAETIVRLVVGRMFVDPSVTAALLRIHFHDCFSKGCDASILIHPTPQKPTPQKTAPPNRSVRGFNIIDAVKGALELACPATVSCADAIALATGDAVALSSGGGIRYPVPTGRLDGLLSTVANVKLPAPTQSVYLAFTQFFSTFESPAPKFREKSLSISSSL